MSQLIDIVRRSLPAPDWLVLEGVEETEIWIIVRVRGRTTPRCPSCSSCQVSYHSRYQRQLHDLPWQGQPVRIYLRIRRNRCGNRQCSRKIFAERLPGVAAPGARETDRRCEVVRRVGYVLGGLPGSRLLERLGMKASRDTLLRRAKKQPAHPAEMKVRVLGVDDWARRKHQKYGTLRMDLERRRIIDPLPVRSAANFADWLRRHPGVEMIARNGRKRRARSPAKN